MYNLIILEGLDKCGKTTYARRLEKDGYIYKHFSKPDDGEDVFKTYMSFLTSLDKSKKYVVDRFNMGEMVYGWFYRNSPAYSEDRYEMINLLISQWDHLFIYFCNEPEFIRAKFLEDKEESTKEKDIEQLKQIYGKYYDKLWLNKDFFMIGHKEFTKYDQLNNS